MYRSFRYSIINQLATNENKRERDMFKSQSGLDKLTAEIESALGGKNSNSTSNNTSYSADENDMNSHNDVNYQKQGHGYINGNGNGNTKGTVYWTTKKRDTHNVPDKSYVEGNNAQVHGLEFHDERQHNNSNNYNNMYPGDEYQHDNGRQAPYDRHDVASRYEEEPPVMSHHSITNVSNSSQSDSENSSTKHGNKILRMDFRTSTFHVNNIHTHMSVSHIFFHIDGLLPYSIVPIITP